MKKIIILLLEMQIKTEINKRNKSNNMILRHAYNDVIKSYRQTIMFLSIKN